MGTVKGHFIIGGAKRRVSGKGTVLGFVYEFPWVFNAGTYGEGLAYHGQALLIKHFYSISGRMAQCQYQGICFQVVGSAIFRFIGDTLNVVVINDEIR